MEAPHLPQSESSDPVAGDTASKARTRRRFSARHGVAMPVILLLITYLGFETRVLWREWEALRGEWNRDARSRVIGYSEVIPKYSYAKPPVDWLHDEGNHTLLWSGWNREKNQHQWFRVGRGDLDSIKLSHSIGRDTVRVIDRPLVEPSEGEIWKTIPDDNLVAATSLMGVPIAYPHGVLDKVLVVNDMLPDTPLLVVYAPFEDQANIVCVYDPVLDSERLTMGHSGYLCDGQPLLYDRKTESLWLASQRGMSAIAGPLRGSVLDRLTRMDNVPWGTWKSDHPDTRLVVGSTRATRVAGE